MVANAQTNKPRNNIVEEIASKFHLNSGEVQKVFDENHQEMKAKHEQEQKDQLARLVASGKLTQEQADKVTAKFVELQAQHDADQESMQNKTPEERKATKDANKAEMEKWAKDNGIDLALIKGFRKGGPRP